MKYVIFDFDGTVADTLPHILKIGQKMLGVEVDPSELEELRNTPVKKLIRRFNVPLYKIPSLVVKARKIFTEHIHEVDPIEGLPAIIKKLDEEGYHLMIISSNSATNIQVFLEHHGLRKHFKSIYGNVGLFSKVQAIKKVLKSQGIGKDNCVYVGDEVRDIDAAHKVGIPVIATTHGLNGEKILAAAKPDFLAKNAQEILAAVQQLDKK